MSKKKDCSCKQVVVKDDNCKVHGEHGHHHCCCCHHHHWCHCPPRWNPYWSGPYYTSGGFTSTSSNTYTINGSSGLTTNTVTFAETEPPEE